MHILICSLIHTDTIITVALAKMNLKKWVNKARIELASWLLDVHGDRPIFDYPVMSFDEFDSSAYKSIGK